MIPFTQDQFLDLFAAYNRAIWPAQVAAYALGTAMAVMPLLSRAWSAKAELICLALLWAWTGIAYHITFFATINPAAVVFGALFVMQTALLTFAAWRSEYSFEPRALWGWVLIAFALIGYPALGALLGHAFPRVPMFGVTPCPLTIFTFGVLLLLRPRAPWMALAIPLAWTVVGGSAAFLLNVPQDWSLPIAGALVVVLRLAPARRRAGTGAHRAR
jgi:hypothetical protein